MGRGSGNEKEQLILKHMEGRKKSLHQVREKRQHQGSPSVLSKLDGGHGTCVLNSQRGALAPHTAFRVGVSSRISVLIRHVLDKWGFRLLCPGVKNRNWENASITLDSRQKSFPGFRKGRVGVSRRPARGRVPRIKAASLSQTLSSVLHSLTKPDKDL